MQKHKIILNCANVVLLVYHCLRYYDFNSSKFWLAGCLVNENYFAYQLKNLLDDLNQNIHTAVGLSKNLNQNTVNMQSQMLQHQANYQQAAGLMTPPPTQPPRVCPDLPVRITPEKQAQLLRLEINKLDVQFRNERHLLHKNHQIRKRRDTNVIEQQLKTALSESSTVKNQDVNSWWQCLQDISNDQIDKFEQVFMDAQLNDKGIFYIDQTMAGHMGNVLSNWGEYKFLTKFGYTQEQVLKCHTRISFNVGEDWCDQIIQNNVNQTYFNLAVMSSTNSWNDIVQDKQFHEKRNMYIKNLLTLGVKIVVFPNIIQHRHPHLLNIDAAEIHAILANTVGVDQGKKYLIFSWKNSNSYRLAKKVYPFATHFLVSDLMFHIGPKQVPLAENPKDMLFLLRKDWNESKNYVMKELTKMERTDYSFDIGIVGVSICFSLSKLFLNILNLENRNCLYKKVAKAETHNKKFG